MPQYVASAIKYRPQRFSDVLGQASSVKVLQNAIRLNRIANVYLFSGPRGTGKTTLARLLAKALNCDDLERQKAAMEQPDPCDKCRSCVGIRHSKDTEVLELDAASHNGVDAMRELMQIASQQPKQGKWRILLLDECFPAGTMIGSTPIEHVRVGDLAPSFDEVSQRLVYRRVTNLFVRRPSGLVRVRVGDRFIVCTPNHPFYTDSGWQPAVSLLLGQRVLTRPYENVDALVWTRVASVEVLQSGSDGEFGGLCPGGLVYNIEVEGTHTYLANDVVVHNCHMLTKEAQNSLLKLAEEPPDHFLLILCTTEPEKILPTIRSRCSKFAIRPLPPKDVIGSLRRIFEESAQPITEDALTALSLVGHGSLRDVQQVADQLINNACGLLVDDDILEMQAGIPSIKLYKRLAAGLSQAWTEGPRIWFELCEELYNEGHDFEQIFFEMLVNIIRDCRVALVSADSPAPCVPYWTGIPHQLFQQHLCFTSRDLDIMNEAWNEKEGHFDVVFGRAVVELWLLQAWDVMQFELPERIAFVSKFPELDKKSLDQKWRTHKQLEKKLLCRCSFRNRYGFDVPCASSSGCEAVGVCCGRVVFFFDTITVPIAENVRPWRGSFIHHRSAKVE